VWFCFSSFYVLEAMPFFPFKKIVDIV